MRSRDRVAIGYCDPGQVDGAFCADLFTLAGRRPDRLGSLLRVEGTGLLSRIRNQLVADRRASRPLEVIPCLR